MGERQTCVDCGILSPETDTNYTLIGSRHGWRLTRRIESDGSAVAEWRCPPCWRAYKGSSDEKAPPSTERFPQTRPASETRRASAPVSDEPDPTLVTGTAPPKRRSRSSPPKASRKR